MAPFRYWEPYDRRPVRRQRSVEPRRISTVSAFDVPDQALLRALQEFTRNPGLTAPDQLNGMSAKATRPSLH